MQLLKDRIAQEGKVLPGSIVKVDGFLNHRVDVMQARNPFTFHEISFIYLLFQCPFDAVLGVFYYDT